MTHTPQNIQRIYLLLMLLYTLAASFIWGINTLFLLDAGLNNIEAFAANAFFTFGQVLFEVPTGIIADTLGRRISYMLGVVTLSVSTLLYYFAWQTQAPFEIWAGVSILLGLGFTFFSGATEAWLVDALKYTGYKGSLESVFAKGQIMGGIAMLVGSVSGGYIAQATDLGVPYLLRAGVLVFTFIIAFLFMKDLGFKPERSKNVLLDIKKTFSASFDHGLRKKEIRWIMLEAPFTMGVNFYVFYAMQPYLLELYGDKEAYGIAGLAAAIVAGAQIIGGLLVPYIRKLFKKRTSLLITTLSINVLLMILIALTDNFYVAIALLVVWALMSAARMPVRQAYLNDLIPSNQRATVLSFDSLLGSSGGVVIQPILGRAADVWNYSTSYLVGSVFQIIAVPFVILARKENTATDTIKK